MVYAVNPKGHDISLADNYGKVVVLWPEKGMNPFALDTRLAELRAALRASQSQDLVLLCGSTPLNTLTTSYMLENHGKVNLLIYSHTRQDYEVRSYTREELHGIGTGDHAEN